MRPRINEERLKQALAGLPPDTEMLTDLDRALLDLRDARGLLEDCLPFLSDDVALRAWPMLKAEAAVRLHRSIAIACGALKGTDA